jgi:hypothetical protein
LSSQKRRPEELSIERLRELLTYDAERGHFFRNKSSGRRKAGDRAGYINNQGYELIWLDGKWFLAHRLAYYYCTGIWPTHEIDHINSNPSDNRFCNLRHVTRSENMQNVEQGGWHFDKKSGKWQAMIRANKTRLYLGRFDTEERARQAYQDAAEVHHPYRKPAPAKQEALEI